MQSESQSDTARERLACSEAPVLGAAKPSLVVSRSSVLVDIESVISLKVNRDTPSHFRTSCADLPRSSWLRCAPRFLPENSDCHSPQGVRLQEPRSNLPRSAGRRRFQLARVKRASLQDASGIAFPHKKYANDTGLQNITMLIPTSQKCSQPIGP